MAAPPFAFALVSSTCAGAAFQSIQLATTGLHVRGQECFGRRGFALESVAARIRREAGGRCHFQRDDGARFGFASSRHVWSLTTSRSLVDVSLQWTRWCVHCTVTGVVAQAARRRKERTCPRARLVVLAVEVADVRLRPGHSLPSWQRHVPGKNHDFSEGGLSKFGA